MPLGIGLLIVVAFASLFAISFHDPKPHDLPVAVAGPPAVLERINAGLEQQAPGAFDLRPVADDRAAQAAVRDRAVDGALVLGTDGARLFVASGAGAGTAQTLEAVFGGVAQGAGELLAVTDLAPFDEDDSQGLMPFFLVLAVTIAAMVFRIVAFVLHRTVGDPTDRRGLRDELAQLLGFAALASAAIAVVFALGSVFEGNLWALSGLAGLLGLAVAVTAVRNTVYFDGAATTRPVLVLAAWAVGALVLFGALGLWQTRTRATTAVQPGVA
jgi:hypothetical protein